MFLCGKGIAMPQTKFSFFLALQQLVWPLSGLFLALFGILLKFSPGNPACQQLQQRWKRNLADKTKTACFVTMFVGFLCVAGRIVNSRLTIFWKRHHPLADMPLTKVFQFVPTIKLPQNSMHVLFYPSSILSLRHSVFPSEKKEKGKKIHGR